MLLNNRSKKDYLLSQSLKRRIRYINQLLAAMLLVVFAIELTPFSTFHDHHSQSSNKCSKGEVKCMHKQHIVTHSENCLICSMHFEKTYTLHQFSLQVFLKEGKVADYAFEDKTCYTRLIRTSLRGPPSLNLKASTFVSI